MREATGRSSFAWAVMRSADSGRREADSGAILVDEAHRYNGRLAGRRRRHPREDHRRHQQRRASRQVAGREAGRCRAWVRSFDRLAKSRRNRPEASPREPPRTIRPLQRPDSHTLPSVGAFNSPVCLPVSVKPCDRCRRPAPSHSIPVARAVIVVDGADASLHCDGAPAFAASAMSGPAPRFAVFAALRFARHTEHHEWFRSHGSNSASQPSHSPCSRRSSR